MTVHKLLIHRGDQTIDVLAGGQTFTVVRREPNLENATLDGVLTANIQPEGLQVGDVLEFALSIRSSDPVLKGHVEDLVAAWNGLPLQEGHLHIQWPSSLALRLRRTADLPALTPVTSGGESSVDLTLNGLQPIVPPKGAPLRYAMGRLVEATDFKSWADLAALMAPLYVKAATIPAQGPLRVELERIRGLSADPKARALAALQLVQDRVRYVALVMGQGGLAPADAETTWARRYGDCKAKTALLLALLHELGVQAEPVMVNTVAGDGLDGRLPMIALFDHVLVRATIGGRVYWLDGARSGDGDLDRLTTPNYGWGLPLVPTGATLVRMLPPPPPAPTQILSIRIDASAGILAPAPAKTELTLSGDDAQAMKLALANLVGDARDQALRNYWRGQYNFIDVKSVTADFDSATGEERLSMDGVAHMDWSAGYYVTDGMGIGYKADFSRDPGPDQDAPFATQYPYYAQTTETIVLPPSFHLDPAALNADLDQTIAGVEYHRHASIQGNAIVLEKTERSLVPEFPAKDAPAAQRTLSELADRAVAITKPSTYLPTDQDLQSSMAATPTSATGFIDRGNMLSDHGRFDDAISDFDHAIALDPKSAYALADRAIALFWKRDYAGAKRDEEAASVIDPKNLIVAHVRGMLAEQKGDHAAAIAAFSEALAINPADAFAFTQRAMAESASGDSEAALRDAAEALKLSPRGGSMHVLRANIFRSQGKTDAAIAEAEALTADPNPYSQVAAGNLLSALGKSADAMQAYARALAVKPEPYIYLSRSQSRPVSDLAGKRADLDAALALDPKYSAALWEKGWLQIRQNDLPGAIATFSSGLATSPDDVNLLQGRGIAYAKSGDTAHADADFEVARAHASGPSSLNTLCWSKATAGVAFASALADCDAALVKAPQNPAILDSRAFVLLRLGRLDDAIAGYDLALVKRPGQAASLYGRGVAWSRKGDKARSDADIAAAMKADPKVKEQFDGYGVRP